MRFKRRYFTVELIFQNESTPQQLNNKGSSSSIKIKNIQDTIHKSIERLYGDLGMAQMMPSFSIIYFNSNTNLLILRIARDFEIKFHNLLTFTKTIDDELNVYFHVLHVSGSIKKCKKFLLEYCYNDYVRINANENQTSSINKEVLNEINEKIS